MCAKVLTSYIYEEFFFANSNRKILKTKEIRILTWNKCIQRVGQNQNLTFRRIKIQIQEFNI